MISPMFLPCHWNLVLTIHSSSMETRRSWHSTYFRNWLDFILGLFLRLDVQWWLRSGWSLGCPCLRGMRRLSLCSARPWWSYLALSPIALSIRFVCIQKVPTQSTSLLSLFHKTISQQAYFGAWHLKSLPGYWLFRMKHFDVCSIQIFIWEESCLRQFCLLKLIN